MSIGARIKKYRKRLGLSQVELAEKAGIAVNSLRLYEAEKREPKLESIDKLAAALGIPREKLLVVEVYTQPIVEAILKSLPELQAEQKEKQLPNTEELSESELMLLSAFRSLTEDQKRFVLRQLQAAAQGPGDPGAV